MYLGSSLKMGAGTETSKFCSGHDHKIMMEVEVYCKHKIDLTVLFIGEEWLSLFTLLNT